MAAGPHLAHVLGTRFVQGVSFEWDDLFRFLRAPEFPGREATLRRELAEAILGHLVSPAEFERLTAVDLDSQADVDAFLTVELWAPLFGGPVCP